jgi:hypothetical protein
MERIKSWIESAGSYETSGNFSNLRERTMSDSYRPPSIIRTSNSYDNHDEQFSTVSLNLLSRLECSLGQLSHEEAVKSVLTCPQDRSSYFEALCIRKKHASHYSPTTADLIQSIDQTFGAQLRQIVEQDGALTTTTVATMMMMHHVPSCVIKPPPQEHLHHQYHNHNTNHSHHAHTQSLGHHTQNPHNYHLHQGDPPLEHKHQNHLHNHHNHHANHSSQSPHRRTSTGGICGGTGGSGGGASSGTAAPGRSRRFFFPESGFFGGRKVKNIDWKLTEAVQQVQSLRLDGSSDHNTPKNNSAYDPPTTPTAGLKRLPL